MNHRSGPRHSIFVQLAVLFLAFIGGLLAITVTMNTDAARNIEREVRENVQSRIRFYVTDMEQEVRRIEELESQYVIDQELMLLSVDAGTLSPYARLEAIRGLRQRLAILEASSNYLEEAFIAIRSLDRIVVNDDFVTGIDDRFYESLREPVDGTSLAVGGDTLYVVQRYPSVEDPRVESLYVVGASFSDDHLRTVLKQVLGPHEGSAQLRIANHQWTLRHVTPGFDDQVGQVLRFHQASVRLPVAITVAVSAEDVLGSVGRYRRWFWLAVAASVLSIGAFGLLSFRIVHRPLHLLVDAFQNLHAGNLDVTLTEHRRDEFDYLYDSFNRMTERIRELIRSVYEQEILRQQSELKRLQSQINPHFLYNNFFVLYRMIKAARIEDAARLAQYMGSYFRFVTRDGRNEDALSDEVAHARTYSDIQSLSFGDRINVDFPEPPAEVARLKVPRLVLQPLLENAYEHALEHRTVGAELHVSYMERGSRLDILVEDNGERISDDEISELNRKLRDSEHAPVTEREHRTGLANVHRRVLLRYGPGYGVELSRSAHGGLRVRLSIPIPSARDEPHDENTGS